MKTFISFIIGGILGALLTCTLQSSAVDKNAAVSEYISTVEEDTGVKVCVTTVERLPLSPNADLSNSVRESALLIPEKSIVWGADNPQVYIVNSDHAYLRPIKIGKSLGGLRVVLEGLAAGGVIINENVQNLENGSKVRVINQIEPVNPEFEFKDWRHSAERR